ncbi:MAG: archaeosortase/exosortase family protein [Rhizobiaceae bacterium]|nr:archaeosortase/exosortase family protein [Rhizobiaceae bacterium]
MTRAQLYAGLFAVGFLNGISERFFKELGESGALGTVFNTFGISALVWVAAGGVFWLLKQAGDEPIRPFDYVLAVVACLGFLFPISAASWLGVALMALYLVWTSTSGTPFRRVGVLMFGITIPMLWARLLFASFSNLILSIDAKLVGFVVGTGSAGNTIPFWDGTGVLFLEPACSSLTNVSLALLCGVFFMSVFNRKWSLTILKAVVLACAATVAINVVRMSAIAFFPAYYDVIHGAVGASLAEWLSIIAVLSIYFRWIDSDAPARA